MSIRENEDMQSVKATIIMAAYNTEEYIKEAIDSVLQQTYTDFELLIIDDASTDNTLNVIKEYTDSRIRLIRNQKNLGQTKCLNIGIKEAIGKYILIMDSDDISYPNRLNIQIEFMEQNPQIVMACSWLKFFGKRNNVFQTVVEHEWIRAQLVLNNVIGHGTSIIRKSVLDAYGIEYNESIRYAQDYYFFEEMSTHGKVAVIPHILLKCRTHDKQVSIAKKKEQMACAGVTIKRVLKDLHITLSETDFELWLRFCFADLGDVSKEEEQIIRDIIKQIEVNNEELCLYNRKILAQVLEERLAFPNVRRTYNNIDEKFLLQIDILEKWLKKKIEGQGFDDYFIKRNCRKIAIYGMAVLGKRLVDELENTDVEVSYFLDNNKGAHYKELDRKDLEYRIDDVDAVVVTPIQCFDEITKGLNVSDSVRMISLQDVIYGI